MTKTKLSTPFPPPLFPSPTKQVKWPVSKERKSMKYPKDTYSELVFPCQCFENWEKKKTQINTTLSDQDLVIAIAVKNKHTKIKKKRKRKTKQNKTKNNSNGKWSKAYYVVSSNKNKNKNHFSYLVHIKVAIMISLMIEEKRRDWKRVSVCILTW